jgi:hypothetical protein
VPREFTCASCGGTFTTSADWSDADALIEFQGAFSEEMRTLDAEPPAEVCDVCYKAMMADCSPEEAMEEYRRDHPRDS